MFQFCARIRSIFVVALLCAYSVDASAQAFVWGQPLVYGGSVDAYVTKMDGDANHYTIGSFSGTFDADPGPDTQFLTSAGSDDVFLQKVDANGELVWAFSLGGTGYDNAYALAIDHLGFVYIAGSYNDVVDFDPDLTVTSLTAHPDGSNFLLKLTASADLIWVQTFGDGGVAAPFDMEVDANGNIVIAGITEGVVDVDPGLGVANAVPGPGSTSSSK